MEATAGEPRKVTRRFWRTGRVRLDFFTIAPSSSRTFVRLALASWPPGWGPDQGRPALIFEVSAAGPDSGESHSPEANSPQFSTLRLAPESLARAAPPAAAGARRRPRPQRWARPSAAIEGVDQPAAGAAAAAGGTATPCGHCSSQAAAALLRRGCSSNPQHDGPQLHHPPRPSPSTCSPRLCFIFRCLTVTDKSVGPVDRPPPAGPPQSAFPPRRWSP